MAGNFNSYSSPAKHKIPRTHCFSLSDFHDFEKCQFRFFVTHHLGKKYELSESSQNQAIGSLLDLAIKKFHAVKAYGQPAQNLSILVKAAEVEMRDHVIRNGQLSFYGGQVKFLDPETISQATEIFTNYYQALGDKIKRSISAKTFWDSILESSELTKIWGGPDCLELGEDNIPEVADYKYFDNLSGKDHLDMDLMPKLYTYLCADELLKLGYKKARFIIRLWQEPNNDSLFEEFDLEEVLSLEDKFKQKVDTILKNKQLSCCNKQYCTVCNSNLKDQWIKELNVKGLIVIETLETVPILSSSPEDVLQS